MRRPLAVQVAPQPMPECVLRIQRVEHPGWEPGLIPSWIWLFSGVWIYSCLVTLFVIREDTWFSCYAHADCVCFSASETISFC